jgi:hypothetical protein
VRPGSSLELRRWGCRDLDESLRVWKTLRAPEVYQMFDVVHLSTQYMTDEDLSALSAYLFDLDAAHDTSLPPPAPKPVELAPALAASAHTTYRNLCSACHGAERQGIPNQRSRGRRSCQLDAGGLGRSGTDVQAGGCRIDPPGQIDCDGPKRRSHLDRRNVSLGNFGISVCGNFSPQAIGAELIDRSQSWSR